MEPSDYRKQYATKLDDAAKTRSSAPASEDAVGPAMAALDGGDDEASRVAAIQTIATGIGRHPELIDRMIDLVRDPNEPPGTRKAALTVIQQASFLTSIFASKRAEYLDALRSVVDDKDPELRRRAIGILARENDEYVQRRLVEGLEDHSKALVPASKAIQFLGYDVHAEQYGLLRRIVEHPPNQAAKREAVRLLAGDPASKDLLTHLLEDRKESVEIRTLAAIALQSLAPEEFQQHARRIVLDETEDERLQATCVNALTQFADPGTYADEAFSARVSAMQEGSASQPVKRATTKYASRANR